MCTVATCMHRVVCSSWRHCIALARETKWKSHNPACDQDCCVTQAVVEAEAVRAARVDVVQAKQGLVKAINEEVIKLRSTLRHLRSSQRAPAFAADVLLLSP